MDREDLAWAGAAAAISAILFATTLYSHPGLGDAPESAAGIASTGILHAPGYPAYVFAGRIFTALVPFGSFAFKVNLFSLVCGAVSIGLLYLLARRCGAARWASMLGALALACGGAFWFYSDYAKHDVFSGLAFLATLYFLVAWQEKPSTGRLVAVGVALAIGIGSSWPLMLFLLPAIGFALLLARRQLSIPSVAVAAAACVAVVVATYGFLMVRASADPAVNWGDATTLGSLSNLVNRADFTYNPPQGPSSSPSSPSPPQQSGPVPAGAVPAASSSQQFKNTAGYAVIFYHELGLAALALAAFGLLASFVWRRGPPSYSLLLAFGANLIGTGLVVGAASYFSFDDVLAREGFIIGCYFPLAVWVAIGSTELAYAAGESGSPRDRASQRTAVKWAAPPLLALAVLLPSLIAHWDVPRRSGSDYADSYARSAFAEVPRGAAVFVFGAERTQPLVYRQVVLDDRPDLGVVATDGLSHGWYRQQIADRLGVAMPPAVGYGISDAASAIAAIRRTRPVYVDLPTAQVLRYVIGYRQVGLLARVTASPPVPKPGQAVGPRGTGPQPVSDPDRVAGQLSEAERTAGMPNPDWGVWPNNYVLNSYTTAEFELARAYFQKHDASGLRRVLENVLRINPGNKLAEHNLRALNTQGLPGG